ncbi:MAG: alpha/beta hydrolase fold domain-containing protein [Planctomycetota bacterium]|jgi:acetyl esterase/lipase
MPRKPKHSVLFLISLAVISAAAASPQTGDKASSPQIKLLWPKNDPYSKGGADGDRPTLTLYLPPPEKNTGAAVVICPGGGYRGLAINHEGRQVAEWLNSFGVAGLVLKYRTRRAGYGHPVPSKDAQRAIRTARTHAGQWNIDPHRIGVLGFSAGGHLASTVGTHFDTGAPNSDDPVERASCRPDFMILIYPVITFTEPFVSKGSRRNLLGEYPDPQLLHYLSNEKQVTPETPPTFLVHTADDKTVSVENSLSFYRALKDAKVPAEMHIYQTGRHGFGLGIPGNTTSNWPPQCAQWMRQMGFLDKRQFYTQQRWPPEKAWNWYKQRPWLVGFNYVPSTACNTTEWWQSYKAFDEETIDRELGWAAELGFNTTRAFVQYIAWKRDPDTFKRTFDRFLALAAKHGISVMPVLFDDCTFGDPRQTEPYLGRQREPIPGMILPSWTPSPGHKRVTDRSEWPGLERYVKDMVGSFGRDKRVLIWDLYNEPGASGMGDKSLPLLKAAFAWAGQADPDQPLTVAPYSRRHKNINDASLSLSDIISFHAYTDYNGMKKKITEFKKHGRPVICTEWMARAKGSRFEKELPLFKREGVGCYSWGLVSGRTQCQFPWSNKRGGTVDPKTGWFHDILHPDGTPYRPDEIKAIRKYTADKNIEWENK